MFTNVIVHHVHWLHVRAQLMRWREEVTLTGYEMHWVVRYFLNKSRTCDHLISGTGTNMALRLQVLASLHTHDGSNKHGTIWPTVLIVYLPQ